MLFTFSSGAQTLYNVCFNSCISLPFEQDMSAIKILESVDGNGSVSLIAFGEQVEISNSFVLYRSDANGSQIWNKLFRVDSNEILIHNINDTIIRKYLSPLDMVSSINSGYFISASLDSFITVIDTAGNYSFFDSTSSIIIHTDTSGTLIWSKKIETPVESAPVKMIYDNAGSALYILSHEIRFPGDSVFYLIKMDTLGNVLWSSEFYGQPGNISASDFILNNNMLYISLGIDSNILMLKTDTSGNIIWSNNYNAGYEEGYHELISLVNTNNGLALAFNRHPAPHPTLTFVDSNGSILSAKSYATDTAFYLTNFMLYNPDRLLMFQQSDSFTFTGRLHKNDFWVINSSNNYQLHENLLTASYYYGGSTGSIYWFSFANFVKTPAGLLALIEQKMHFNFYGADMFMPELVQMDSVCGKACWFNPTVVLNHIILNVNITSSPVILSNPIIALNISNANIITYDSLLDPHVHCLGTVGINNHSENSGMAEIYPNPFYKNATLTLSSEFEIKNAELNIYNSLGKLIKKTLIFNSESSISRDGLTGGIYFFRVTNQKNQFLSGKFVIE